MSTTRRTERTPGSVPHTHPEEVVGVHERALAGSSAQGRRIEIEPGRKVHVIETGEGPPLVLLHGSSTSALLLLPLLERLDGVRAIAVDRPGFGLSEPIDVPPERFADATVEWLDSLLDALGLDVTALLGNSMGGVWALWYALAHPERVSRLVLLGATPLLPGTRVPLPLRVMVTPKLGELLQRLIPPSRKMVVRMMGFMGEKRTIIDYPDQIDALIAAGNDPVAARVNLAELRAVLSPFGYRRELRMKPDELGRLTVPTLLVWGEQDPVGGPMVARVAAQAIRDTWLELLPAGHGPWLGHPDRVAELVTRFVR